MTVLKGERPWLVVIHGVNHRLELVIKDAVQGIVQFAKCKMFYTNTCYLFKHLGKLKTKGVKRDKRGLQSTWYNTLPIAKDTRNMLC